MILFSDSLSVFLIDDSKKPQPFRTSTRSMHLRIAEEERTNGLKEIRVEIGDTDDFRFAFGAWISPNSFYKYHDPVRGMDNFISWLTHFTKEREGIDGSIDVECLLDKEDKLQLQVTIRSEIYNRTLNLNLGRLCGEDLTQYLIRLLKEQKIQQDDRQNKVAEKINKLRFQMSDMKKELRRNEIRLQKATKTIKKLKDKAKN